MPSPEAIADFKRRYSMIYGVEISDEKALELGMRLIRLVKAVYGDDVPKKWKQNKIIDSKGRRI